MESLAHTGLEIMELFKLVDAIEDPISATVDKEPYESLKTRLTAEADRFELWAVNLGLFVSGHGSLDYRVRDAGGIRDTLCRFMKSLSTSLQEAIRYLNGEIRLFMREEDDDTDSEPDSDVDLLLSNVKDPIDRLFKLSIWIRNPATRLASSKAQQFQQVDEETNVDLFKVFEVFDYDYVSSLFLEYKKHAALQEKETVPPVVKEDDKLDKHEESETTDHVWDPIRDVLLQFKNDISNGTESFLVRRIAHANVRRRKQFAYWRKHREKLRQHTTAALPPPSRGNMFQPPVQPRTNILGDPLAKTLAQSVTTASRLNIPQMAMNEDMYNVPVSEYSPSAWEPSKDVVDFPPAPVIPGTERFFECPYCFTICSTALLAEKAWKAHLIHDLRPYVCTYKECQNPDQLYDNRQDWVQHENYAHRRVFRCPEHESMTFSTLAAYQVHVHEQHDDGSSLHESILVRHLGESTITKTDRRCPVCSLVLETVQKMQNHIALHLERPSLFSLPRFVGGDEDNAAESDNAALDSDGSRAGELDVDLIFEEHTGEGVPYNTAIETETDDRKYRHALSGVDYLASPSMQRGQDMLRQSEQEIRQILEKNKEVLGEEHPEIQKGMANLVLNYRYQDRLDKAEELQGQVLEISKKLFGPDHPNTLARMTGLASIYQSQNRWEEAEELEEKVLETSEKLLGPDHPNTLASMANLASIYQKRNRWKKAEELLEKVLETNERVFGSDHHDTLMSMSNLASMYQRQHRWKEAEELQKQVLQTSEKIFGPDHSGTLMSMSNLASIYQERNRWKEAEELLEKVLETNEKVFGSDHPDTLMSMSNLASVYQHQQRWKEAEELQKQVLETSIEAFGVVDHRTLDSMFRLASVWWGQGRLKEAEALNARVIVLHERLNQRTSPFKRSRSIRLVTNSS